MNFLEKVIVNSENEGKKGKKWKKRQIKVSSYQKDNSSYFELS